MSLNDRSRWQANRAFALVHGLFRFEGMPCPCCGSTDRRTRQRDCYPCQLKKRRIKPLLKEDHAMVLALFREGLTEKEIAKKFETGIRPVRRVLIAKRLLPKEKKECPKTQKKNRAA